MSAPWECPRCKAINAPHASQCPCKPVAPAMTGTAVVGNTLRCTCHDLAGFDGPIWLVRQPCPIHNNPYITWTGSWATS